jgi:predicted ribosome quality control (RQC) complex YloA/Tae2 family protein
MNQELQTSHTSQEEKHFTQTQVTHALSTIDQYYQQEIASFKESLQAHQLEIEKCKNHLELLEKESQEDEKALEGIARDIEYEMRHFEERHSLFLQKGQLLREFYDAFEGVEGESHQKVFHQKEQELCYLLDELHTQEQSLLEKELARQNLLQKLNPIRTQINQLHYQLKNLEEEKKYLQTMKLSPLASQQPLTLSQKPSEEVIEAEIETKA